MKFGEEIEQEKSNQKATEETLSVIVDEKLGGIQIFSVQEKIVAMFIVLLIIYILYVIVMKPNVSGRWTDDSGNNYVFKQRLFLSFGKYTAKDTKDAVWNLSGTVKGPNVSFKNVNGVWDYRNLITFPNDMKLRRVLM